MAPGYCLNLKPPKEDDEAYLPKVTRSKSISSEHSAGEKVEVKTQAQVHSPSSPTPGEEEQNHPVDHFQTSNRTSVGSNIPSAGSSRQTLQGDVDEILPAVPKEKGRWFKLSGKKKDQRPFKAPKEKLPSKQPKSKFPKNFNQDIQRSSGEALRSYNEAMEKLLSTKHLTEYQVRKIHEDHKAQVLRRFSDQFSQYLQSRNQEIVAMIIEENDKLQKDITNLFEQRLKQYQQQGGILEPTIQATNNLSPDPVSPAASTASLRTFSRSDNASPASSRQSLDDLERTPSLKKDKKRLSFIRIGPKDKPKDKERRDSTRSPSPSPSLSQAEVEFRAKQELDNLNKEILQKTEEATRAYEVSMRGFVDQRFDLTEDQIRAAHAVSRKAVISKFTDHFHVYFNSRNRAAVTTVQNARSNLESDVNGKLASYLQKHQESISREQAKVIINQAEYFYEKDMMNFKPSLRTEREVRIKHMDAVKASLDYFDILLKKQGWVVPSTWTNEIQTRLDEKFQVILQQIQAAEPVPQGEEVVSPAPQGTAAKFIINLERFPEVPKPPKTTSTSIGIYLDQASVIVGMVDPKNLREPQIIKSFPPTITFTGKSMEIGSSESNSPATFDICDLLLAESTNSHPIELTKFKADLTADEIITAFFEQILREVKASKKADFVSNVVVTIPFVITSLEKERLLQALKAAGAAHVRILSTLITTAIAHAQDTDYYSNPYQTKQIFVTQALKRSFSMAVVEIKPRSIITKRCTGSQNFKEGLLTTFQNCHGHLFTNGKLKQEQISFVSKLYGAAAKQVVQDTKTDALLEIKSTPGDTLLSRIINNAMRQQFQVKLITQGPLRGACLLASKASLPASVIPAEIEIYDASRGNLLLASNNQIFLEKFRNCDFQPRLLFKKPVVVRPEGASLLLREVYFKDKFAPIVGQYHIEVTSKAKNCEVELRCMIEQDGILRLEADMTKDVIMGSLQRVDPITIDKAHGSSLNKIYNHYYPQTTKDTISSPPSNYEEDPQVDNDEPRINTDHVKGPAVENLGRPELPLEIHVKENEKTPKPEEKPSVTSKVLPESKETNQQEDPLTTELEYENVSPVKWRSSSLVLPEPQETNQKIKLPPSLKDASIPPEGIPPTDPCVSLDAMTATVREFLQHAMKVAIKAHQEIMTKVTDRIEPIKDSELKKFHVDNLEAIIQNFRESVGILKEHPSLFAVINEAEAKLRKEINLLLNHYLAKYEATISELKKKIKRWELEGECHYDDEMEKFEPHTKFARQISSKHTEIKADVLNQFAMNIRSQGLDWFDFWKAELEWRLENKLEEALEECLEEPKVHSAPSSAPPVLVPVTPYAVPHQGPERTRIQIHQTVSNLHQFPSDKPYPSSNAAEKLPGKTNEEAKPQKIIKEEPKPQKLIKEEPKPQKILKEEPTAATEKISEEKPTAATEKIPEEKPTAATGKIPEEKPTAATEKIPEEKPTAATEKIPEEETKSLAQEIPKEEQKVTIPNTESKPNIPPTEFLPEVSPPVKKPVSHFQPKVISLNNGALQKVKVSESTTPPKNTFRYQTPSAFTKPIVTLQTYAERTPTQPITTNSAFVPVAPIVSTSKSENATEKPKTTGVPKLQPSTSTTKQSTDISSPVSRFPPSTQRNSAHITEHPKVEVVVPKARTSIDKQQPKIAQISANASKVEDKKSGPHGRTQVNPNLKDEKPVEKVITKILQPSSPSKLPSPLPYKGSQRQTTRSSSSSSSSPKEPTGYTTSYNFRDPKSKPKISPEVKSPVQSNFPFLNYNKRSNSSSSSDDGKRGKKASSKIPTPDKGSPSNQNAKENYTKNITSNRSSQPLPPTRPGNISVANNTTQNSFKSLGNSKVGTLPNAFNSLNTDYNSLIIKSAKNPSGRLTTPPTEINQQQLELIQNMLERAASEGIQLHNKSMQAVAQKKLPLTEKQIKNHQRNQLNAINFIWGETFAPLGAVGAPRLNKAVNNSRANMEKIINAQLGTNLEYFKSVIDKVVKKVKELTFEAENQYDDCMRDLRTKERSRKEVVAEHERVKEEVITIFKERVSDAEVEWSDFWKMELEDKLQEKLHELLDDCKPESDQVLIDIQFIDSSTVDSGSTETTLAQASPTFQPIVHPTDQIKENSEEIHTEVVRTPPTSNPTERLVSPAVSPSSMKSSVPENDKQSMKVFHSILKKNGAPSPTRRVNFGFPTGSQGDLKERTQSFDRPRPAMSTLHFDGNQMETFRPQKAVRTKSLPDLDSNRAAGQFIVGSVKRPAAAPPPIPAKRGDQLNIGIYLDEHFANVGTFLNNDVNEVDLILQIPAEIAFLENELLVGWQAEKSRRSSNHFYLYQLIKMKASEVHEIHFRKLKYTPCTEEIIAMYFKKLHQHVSLLKSAPIGRVIITVPFTVTSAEKERIKNAARIAGLQNIRILSSLVTMAIAYARESRYYLMDRPGMKSILVIQYLKHSFVMAILEIGPSSITTLRCFGSENMPEGQQVPFLKAHGLLFTNGNINQKEDIYIAQVYKRALHELIAGHSAQWDKIIVVKQQETTKLDKILDILFGKQNQAKGYMDGPLLGACVHACKYHLNVPIIPQHLEVYDASRSHLSLHSSTGQVWKKHFKNHVFRPEVVFRFPLSLPPEGTVIVLEEEFFQNAVPDLAGRYQVIARRENNQSCDVVLNCEVDQDGVLSLAVDFTQPVLEGYIVRTDLLFLRASDQTNPSSGFRKLTEHYELIRGTLV